MQARPGRRKDISGRPRGRPGTTSDIYTQPAGNPPLSGRGERWRTSTSEPRSRARGSRSRSSPTSSRSTSRPCSAGSRGRTPYPRHRARVAGALDTTEHALWPDAVPPPTAAPERGQPIPVATDVVAGYGYATDSRRAEPRRRPALSGRADRARHPQRRIPAGPRRPAAREGRGRLSSPRAIIEDPDGQVEPLLGIDGIEIHASPGGEELRPLPGRRQMLLVLHGIGVRSEPPPVILLSAPHQRRAVRSARRRIRATAGSRRRRSPPASASSHTSPRSSSNPGPSRDSPEPTRNRLARRAPPRRRPRRPRTRRAAGHDDRPDPGVGRRRDHQQGRPVTNSARLSRVPPGRQGRASEAPPAAAAAAAPLLTARRSRAVLRRSRDRESPGQPAERSAGAPRALPGGFVGCRRAREGRVRPDPSPHDVR